MDIPVGVALKLMGFLQALMSEASELPPADVIDYSLKTPEENGTQYYIIYMKSGFKDKATAERALKLQKKLHDAVGSL